MPSLRSWRIQCGGKAVEAAEPLFKIVLAFLSTGVKDIDLVALKRGECPPIHTKRANGKPETEADHLAALARRLRRRRTLN